MDNAGYVLVIVGLALLALYLYVTKSATSVTSTKSTSTDTSLSGDPVLIQTNQLDCASVSGQTGVLQIGGQQFYCSGTFQCAPDGSITCRQPQYYYYPTYYYSGFPFWGGRGGHGGHGGHR